MTDGIRALMERIDGASPGWWLLAVALGVVALARPSTRRGWLAALRRSER